MLYILFFIFVIIPIYGIVFFAEGSYGAGFICEIPFLFLISVLLNYFFVERPRKKRQSVIRRMFNIPNCIEYGDKEKMGAGFQNAINSALNNVSDINKREDLKQCELIVKKMSASNDFNGLYKAFRLTGCHIKIIDKDGNLVTSVV